jgi:hypothetical protein
MTSGKPFSPREIAYIESHTHEYPSVIARHLGKHFSEDNLGYRSAASVSTYMRKYIEKRLFQESITVAPDPKTKTDIVSQ